MTVRKQCCTISIKLEQISLAQSRSDGSAASFDCEAYAQAPSSVLQIELVKPAMHRYGGSSHISTEQLGRLIALCKHIGMQSLQRNDTFMPRSAALCSPQLVTPCSCLILSCLCASSLCCVSTGLVQRYKRHNLIVTGCQADVIRQVYIVCRQFAQRKGCRSVDTGGGLQPHSRSFQRTLI